MNLKTCPAMSIFLLAVCHVFLILILSAGFVEAADTYSNPVISEIGPADPMVLRYQDRYYMYPTGDNTSYHVYSSRDLVNWTKGRRVFSPGGINVWAPDVFYHSSDGKFYLYYTADRKVGVAVANRPDETFVNQGILIYNVIDAHMFRDEDGKYYLYFVRPFSTIYVQEMTNPIQLTGSSRLIIQPTEPWEMRHGSITEGPWMIKYEGIYYLLYSGSGADSKYYAVGYATANNPLGPFTKYQGNPIIKGGSGIYGPGHGSVTKDDAGNLWHVYHQKRGPDVGWDRFICIDPMWFDSDGVLHSKATRGTLEQAPIISLAQGYIKFDRDFYSCACFVTMLLADSDLAGQGSQEVTLTTDGGDSETVVLAEKTPAMGVFTGTISTDSGGVNIEDGVLQLSNGEIITATYNDANDGTGNPAIATDSALADCEGPLIFNVRTDAAGSEPIVSFETDEATTARVLCGLACGADYTIEGKDLRLATRHTIKLTGVSAATDYFFIVEATDALGNETVDDNAGDCYAFTTTGVGNIYVPGEYLTIQEGIDQCWDGGTVLVADGTHTGAGNRDIDFRGRSITVRSENGPENCIIDCQGNWDHEHRGFDFHSGEDGNSVLDGFTIKNGVQVLGGAIRCNESSPTVTNCTFSGNLANYGGGMYNYYSSPTLTNCTFIGNSANYGGGMYNYYSSSTITNCSFSGNSAGWDGGGMYNSSSSPTLTNCVFSGNSAGGWEYGGGMYNDGSSPTLTNCIFSGNSARVGGGMYNYRGSPTVTNCTFSGNSANYGGGMYNYYSSPTLTNCTFSGNSASNYGGGMRNWSSPTLANCILWGNTPEQIYGSAVVTYSDVQGGWEGPGNIDADPCFVDLESEDYGLLPTSPCIDAGDNTAVPADITDIDDDGDVNEPIPWDLDGGCRFVDNPDAPDTGNGTPPIVDMGAYEFAPVIEVPMHFTPQALNPGSKGKWLKAHFVLPEGFVVEDVDANVPATLEPVGIESDYINVFAGKGRFGEVGVEIGFDRAAICGAGIDYGPAEVTVMGRLNDCRYFYGTDTIRIITNNLKYLAAFASHWLEADCRPPDWCRGADVDHSSVVDFIDFALFDGCCIEVVKK